MNRKKLLLRKSLLGALITGAFLSTTVVCDVPEVIRIVDPGYYWYEPVYVDDCCGDAYYFDFWSDWFCC